MYKHWYIFKLNLLGHHDIIYWCILNSNTDKNRDSGKLMSFTRLKYAHEYECMLNASYKAYILLRFEPIQGKLQQSRPLPGCINDFMPEQHYPFWVLWYVTIQTFALKCI